MKILTVAKIFSHTGQLLSRKNQLLLLLLLLTRTPMHSTVKTICLKSLSRSRNFPQRFSARRVHVRKFSKRKTWAMCASHTSIQRERGRVSKHKKSGRLFMLAHCLREGRLFATAWCPFSPDFSQHHTNTEASAGWLKKTSSRLGDAARWRWGLRACVRF